MSIARSSSVVAVREIYKVGTCMKVVLLSFDSNNTHKAKVVRLPSHLLLNLNTRHRARLPVELCRSSN